jgi:hypothetical protein
MVPCLCHIHSSILDTVSNFLNTVANPHHSMFDSKLHARSGGGPLVCEALEPLPLITLRPAIVLLAHRKRIVIYLTEVGM